MSVKSKSNIEHGKQVNPYAGRVGLVYARVSSKRQETEGSGLQSQEGRCVHDLRGIHVSHAKTFPDSYTGGGDFMKRPAMRAMLAYIDANPHKKFVVVFDDLKRFARDVEFHLKLRATFRARDVVLRCLNYNFDESPEGQFAELIMAGQAQLEREQNRRQVIQKQKARLEAGYWAFGAKKGYDMVKDPVHGKICVPNAEGAILKEGLELFAKRVLVRKVDLCRFLVEKGFWKKQSPEKYIHLVDNILRDSFHAGFIEYPAWDVSRRLGKHQPLIDSETFGLLENILRRENVHKRVRQDVSDDFALRTLIVCDHCDKHLTGAWSKGRTKSYAYYVCHNKACECYGKSINAPLAEKQFKRVLKRTTLKAEVDALVDVAFDRAWKEEVVNIKTQEAILASEASALDTKAKQLTDAIFAAKSDSVRRLYEKQLEELAQEMENPDLDLIGQIDFSVPYRTALPKARGMLKNPYSVWHFLDVHEKQRLFYFIFEAKLSYNQKTGYRTDKIRTAARLFEEFVEQKPLDVEMGGIEPPCKEKHIYTSTRRRMFGWFEYRALRTNNAARYRTLFL